MYIKVKWKDQNIIPAEVRFYCAYCDTLITKDLACPVLTLFNAQKEVLANIPMENILYYTIQD